MEEEEYFVPLQDQRVFGAGIKRKRVSFVPAATASQESSTSISPKTGDHYLSIVLPRKNSRSEDANPPESLVDATSNTSTNKAQSGTSLCKICHLAIENDEQFSVISTKAHESSIAHQVCLTHSHPPSHLDRNRYGLKYLSSYGWDPDSRLGLGADGNGIRIPIKAKLKNDTVGLGAERIKKSEQAKKPADMVHKLDARQVRKKELEAKKMRERLQEQFYRDEDVELYLRQLH